MLKIEKIKDKSLNLDVQGQGDDEGCWKDCYVGGHWELRADENTMGCVWHNANNTSKTWFFW